MAAATVFFRIMSSLNKTVRTLRHGLIVPLIRLVILGCRLKPRALLRLEARFLGSLFAILPLSANRTIDLHRKRIMKPAGLSVSNASVYYSVILGYFDFFHLYHAGEKAFSKAVSVQGMGHLKKALEGGMGAIAVTAHYSAWELIPRAVSLAGISTGVVGRSLNHQGASGVLERLRAMHGISVIDRDSGPTALVRLLRRNTAVGILIDQDTGRVRSEVVDFLGWPARTPSAPAVLASRMGVPIVPLHITRGDDHRYRLVIEEPLSCDDDPGPEGILEELNRRIAEWIIEDPSQWVWFHRRWKATGIR